MRRHVRNSCPSQLLPQLCFLLRRQAPLLNRISDLCSDLAGDGKTAIRRDCPNHADLPSKPILKAWLAAFPRCYVYWADARVTACPNASIPLAVGVLAAAGANVRAGASAAATAKVDPVPSNPSTSSDPELSVSVPPKTQIFQ